MAKCGACKPIPRMRHRLTVQRLKGDATVDGAGQIDESNNDNWETYIRIAAAIVAKSSREFFGADQVQADITHQFTLRWSRNADAIAARMRAIDGDKTYNLTSAPFDPDGNRKILKLNAVEVR